jgi:transcriptional regulator with XRE-family HTH domain
MTGYRSFNELRNGMSAERRARNLEATHVMLHEMALHELRQAREKSQVELARDLHVGQPAVAKMEQRADMYVSNLRRYVEALGGKLEITARFPDASVIITNFGEIGTLSEQSRQSGKASPQAIS